MGSPRRVARHWWSRSEAVALRAVAQGEVDGLECHCRENSARPAEHRWDARCLSRAQRQLGYQAYSYSFAPSPFTFTTDRVLKDPASLSERVRTACEMAASFDVFQFYFGQSLLGPNLLDVRWLDRLGKKIFFYFCGCDIRDEKKTVMTYPISACAVCPKHCSRNRSLAQATAATYGRVNFVSTPDLLEFVDRAVLLPQAVDFDIVERVLAEPEPPRRDDRFVVAHAPTDRVIKGTQYLVDAVASLQRRGLNMQLMLLEGLPQEEALRRARRADVAVDQLLVGAYGTFAAEMMALGVPTLVYLREDLLPLYPQRPPLLNASPLTIEDLLAELYADRDRLRSLASEARAYCYTFHHPSRLAMKSLEYYQR